MRPVKLALPLFAIFAFSAGCKKSSSTTPPTNVASVIQVDNPRTGLICPNGSPININGTMSDDNGLSTAKVEVKNKTTNTTLYQATVNTGNTTYYRFSWSYTLTGITTYSPGSVKVTAKDQLGNEVSSEVDIFLDN